MIVSILCDFFKGDEVRLTPCAGLFPEGLSVGKHQFVPATIPCTP